MQGRGGDPALRAALGAKSSAVFYVSSDTLMSPPLRPNGPLLSLAICPFFHGIRKDSLVATRATISPTNGVSQSTIQSCLPISLWTLEHGHPQSSRRDSGKPYRRLPISSAKNISLFLDNVETSDKYARWNIWKDIYTKHDAWGQIVKHSVSEEDGTTEYHKGEIVVSDNEESSDDGGYEIDILSESKHRDGSIYRSLDELWKKEYRIVDRNETWLEAMSLSDPADCVIYDGECMEHVPCCMLQIFSLELAKIPMDGGSVELYGYIAVRDELEPLLNYVVNFSRDEPIIVEQGSLINMAGPKRGIDMLDYALIEYDMRIKSGGQEKDDLQLIDGASIIGPGALSDLSGFRLTGGSGAIDLTLVQ